LRFRAITEAAAAAAGCTVTFRGSPSNRTRTMLNNPTLLDLWRKHLAEVGWEDGPVPPSLGSTDMTNVSHGVPTIHPHLAVPPPDGALPTGEFRQHAVGPQADRALMVAARLLAGVALNLFAEPRLVEQARWELRAMRATPVEGEQRQGVHGE